MKKLFLGLILFTISCAPTIKNFDSYQKAPILKAKFMPSKEAVMGEPVKVAVFPLESEGLLIARNSQLGSSIAVDIESLLTKDKLIDLVDRKAYQKLKKEVELAEMGSNKTYKGPLVADYIISGAISKANFTSKYISAKHSFNIESGTYSYIPPKWNYASEVGGNIKVYSIPSLNIIRAFEFDGRSVMSENAKSKSNPKKEDSYLTKEASRNALEKIGIDLKNFFAKKGYILEKKMLKNSAIFKISLGSKDGVKQGDKLIVYSKKEERNALTGENEVFEVKIAEAVIADIINNESSWILVKNKKDIEKIRLGHIVQVKYKKGFWKKFGKASSGAGSVAFGMMNNNSSSITF